MTEYDLAARDVIRDTLWMLYGYDEDFIEADPGDLIRFEHNADTVMADLGIAGYTIVPSGEYADLCDRAECRAAKPEMA